MRKLDPPVRAALRLGAYQLGFVDAVAAARGRRTSRSSSSAAPASSAPSPFTNAVMRRLAEGIAALLAALPAARGRSSTPIPTGSPRRCWRDCGAEEALALMRAQNEPPETVVRLVRGDARRASRPDVPGALHVERVDEEALAEGRIWPQSRGSQLAGARRRLAGRRARCSTSARRPGGKATMLAGEVVAVELHAGPRARARGERAPPRRDERHAS